MHVLKGHGTENDFVVIPDLDGEIDLTPELVRALCDRHAASVPTACCAWSAAENDAEGKDFAGDAEYFMDYRNADGSLAEMCGNGIRVFLRYLMRSQLVTESAAVATRGGITRVRSCTDGDISVHMGRPLVLADRPVATAAPTSKPAIAAVRMPNPHVVVQVEADELDALDLTRAPVVVPPLPDGQNVEFVVAVGPGHLRMRVYERGVGETRSCGTGICAAVVAAATAAVRRPTAGRGASTSPVARAGSSGTTDGTIELIGPAVIVAEIDIDEQWLASVSGGDTVVIGAVGA